MNRVLGAALVVFGVMLALVVFVVSLFYSSAKQKLADEFGQSYYAGSAYLATHLRDQYYLGVLALDDLTRDAEPDEARVGDPARLRLVADMYGDSKTLFFRLDSNGQLTATWPEEARPPDQSCCDLAWQRVSAGGTPEPQFDQTEKGESAMVLVQPIRGAEDRPTGALGLVLDLRGLLIRDVVSEAEQVDALVVQPSDLSVLAATYALTDRAAKLDSLFQTETGSFMDHARQGKSGWELDAVSRAFSPDGKPEPYLIGITGLQMGGRGLVVGVFSPRRATVDRYLRWFVRWIGAIGLVMLLGIASFVTLVGQARVVEREERQRLEERNSLYRISLALLSVSKLDDVLGNIADQARELFKAEGATIALVDPETDTIHFRCVSSRDPQVKAQLQGMRVPLGKGIIGWVVERGESLHVMDASKDPRFTTEIDQQTGIQTLALLCAPLMREGDECFGAIELVNNPENPFPESDLVLLQSLAVVAAAAVERAIWQEREAVQERLRREMEIARTVQEGLLPKTFPILRGFDLGGANRPAREVGGDFFDFIPVGDRHVGVVIADVADKGLGAAMFMVMCRSLLYACATRELSPAAVLESLNSQILEFSRSDLFVTIFYGVLDISTRTFRYTNAGHNPPVFCRADGTDGIVTVPGIALGVVETLGLSEDTVQFEPGDRLVFYTDGITESINPQTQEFGLDRLRGVLRDSTGSDAETTVESILNAVDQFVASEPQFDDITLAAIHAHELGDGPTDTWLEAHTRG